MKIAIVDEIKSLGMRVVGWYHSHPVFQTQPSIKDCSNQTSFQQLFRYDEAADTEPFLGMSQFLFKLSDTCYLAICNGLFHD